MQSDAAAILSSRERWGDGMQWMGPCAGVETARDGGDREGGESTGAEDEGIDLTALGRSDGSRLIWGATGRIFKLNLDKKT